MNEGMPHLQMRRGVWVSFCKIATVSFLSVGYKSDGLYCRIEGTPSSPTLLFIRVEKSRKNDILMYLPDGFGLKIYNPFLTTYSPFSREAHFILLTSLLVLKDLQPRRAEKSK